MNGQQPEVVAKRFSKYVSPKDLVVCAHDFERLNEADFQAKYGTTRRRSRSSAKHHSHAPPQLKLQGRYMRLISATLTPCCAESGCCF